MECGRDPQSVRGGRIRIYIERRTKMEQLLQEMLQKNYGKNIQDASNEEIYTALLEITKEKMAGMKQQKALLHFSGVSDRKTLVQQSHQSGII